jgi:hypothetical protein
MSFHELTGFYPLTTRHCVTGSLRHIYEYHGYHISEDLLLGLGSGLGFIYWHVKGTPPLFGGRANFERPGEKGFEKTVGERTGVVVESHHTSSHRKAEQAMLDLLNAGEPVMVYVDMAYLPYFDLPENYHFGGHTIVVVGYDAETGMVLAADRDGTLHQVSLDALEQARASTYKPFPPRHAWYTFDFSRMRDPRPDEVWSAIGEVCANMLNSPVSNIGVDGIRVAAQRVRQWFVRMTPDELREACWNAFLFIDSDGGTGGGIFRYMYSRFLNEAAVITGDMRLAKYGADLRAAADRWQEAAHVFIDAAELPDPSDALEDVSIRLLKIADREEDVWCALNRIISDLPRTVR